ncbi:MAG: hypothetical protein ACRDK1_05665 [Solirubrobacterales bacterium]
MRARGAFVAVLVAAGLASGCGSSSTDGPPLQPDNIKNPASLLVTNADIDAVGSSTPYGAVLRWWQALQQGNVEAVQASYVEPISKKEAQRQIDGLRPRFSQPINPTVRIQRYTASLDAHIRSASEFQNRPNVISVRDFRVHLYLGKTKDGWKVRTVDYNNYSKGLQRSTLAVG